MAPEYSEAGLLLQVSNSVSMLLLYHDQERCYETPPARSLPLPAPALQNEAMQLL